MTPRRRWHAALAVAAAALFAAASLNAQRPAPAQTGSNIQLIPPQLATLVQSAREDINAYWASQITNYRPPVDVVMVQAPTTTDCGPFERPNARYCSSTHKIYWDVTLFSTQYRLGDFAPVFILAHEWGHLVQRQLGFGRTAEGLMGIQLELQADCLAGTYAANAAARKVLEAGDDDEAILALRRAGDGFDDPWFDSNAHGTAGQRIDAFSYGLDGRSCTAEAFFAFLKGRGVDPSRAPQTPAPAQGALQQLAPRQAGRFELTGLKREQLPGATDVLMATYRTTDNIQLAVAIIAYPSAAAARNGLDISVRDMVENRNFKVIRQGRLVTRAQVESGFHTVMQGPLEAMIWTNGPVLGMVQGPYDVAYELYEALPF